MGQSSRVCDTLYFILKLVRIEIVKNLLFATAALALIAVPVVAGFSDPVIADHGVPDLATIFNGNYHQQIDPFGTIGRTAFDASGRVIGVQIGTYRPGSPNGMTIEMTYLEPDAEHPQGQAFDGAGNPAPLH
jgi:hypothetical protein